MFINPDDKEICEKDYFNPTEQKTLEKICEHLQPLFLITKGLEGNADMDDGVCEASHGALWEQLLMLEHILEHFESLQKEAKAGKFNQYRGI